MGPGLNDLLEPLLQKPPLAEVIRLPGVSPNARAFLAAALCRAGGGPLLWVLPTEAEAEEACRGARFYLGEVERSAADPFAARVVSFPLPRTFLTTTSHLTGWWWRTDWR